MLRWTLRRARLGIHARSCRGRSCRAGCGPCRRFGKLLFLQVQAFVANNDRDAPVGWVGRIGLQQQALVGEPAHLADTVITQPGFNQILRAALARSDDSSQLP